jgi:hypothetical protein
LAGRISRSRLHLQTKHLVLEEARHLVRHSDVWARLGMIDERTDRSIRSAQVVANRISPEGVSRHYLNE